MSNENEIYAEWKNGVDDQAKAEVLEPLSKEVRKHAEAVVWEG